MVPVPTRRAGAAGQDEPKKPHVSSVESWQPGDMERAGDAGLPYVPLGHFTPWERELVKGTPVEEVMDLIQKSIREEANKIQYVQDTSGRIGERLEMLGLPALEYPYDYYDVDDDDYEDSDEYTDDERDSDGGPTYCGLKKSFLTAQDPPSTLSSSHNFVNFTMPMQHRVTPEEAEKNAKELVAEEERIKNKAEKKKLKKQRQKDRKRQQKLEEELKNKKKELRNGKRDLEKGSGGVSSIKEDLDMEKNEKQGVSTSLGKGPSDSKQKGQSKNRIIVEASPKQESSASEDTEESEEEDDIEEEKEAELDMESTFVHQVWRKVESKPKVEKKEKIIKPAAKLLEKLPNKLQEKMQEKKAESFATINPLEQCIQFADLGNKMASGRHFAAAVVYFTEAIKLNPRDYRLFGNRSYCWERMGSYKEALGDAEVSLSLFPQFLKGYFRKGKSLMGMKRYMEAMVTFRHILQEDSTHVDATLALKECERLIQLASLSSGNQMKMPDLVPMSPEFRLPSSVIQQDYANMKAEFSDLSLNSSRPSSAGKDGAILITSSGQKLKGPATPGNQVKSTKEPAGAVSPPKPLAMPSQLYPVWVGNVTPRITGAILLSNFQRYGAIHSIRILYDRTCAFINYASKEAAEVAFLALQGAEVEGTKFVLQLRHPDHASTNPRAAATNLRPTPKEGVKIKIPTEIECHFWRNAGCDNAERCRFRHIPENEGIDQK